MSELNPQFAEEISKYGARHFTACYNCGNCTAVCNLSEEHANFPRMFIRYGLLGEKEKILDSKEIWLCYACGDCSETCPRQAYPGEYMAALRRYTIAWNEKTGLTRLIFTNNPLAIVITLLVAVLLGFMVLTIKPEMIIARWLFTYIHYEVIHNVGLGIFILTGLTAGVGIYSLIRRLQKKDPSDPEAVRRRFSLKRFTSAFNKVVAELATMKRYQTCDTEEDSFWKHKPWLIKPWFIHWSIMWGFIGLLLATILDFVFKNPATIMWLPSRILGTLTGILLMYGTTLAVIYRLTKPTKSYADIKLADWSFLIFLWIGGFTGFWLEAAVMTGWHTLSTQVVFLVHTVVSMELILLFAFSKFAHALYRPLALYFYYSRYMA
jgi:ferredoxin